MQSADLKLYMVSENTRVVFAKRDPHVWSVLLQLGLVAGFFMLLKAPMPVACFLGIGLLFAGFSQELRVLAVEQSALVLITKAWFRAARVRYLPYHEIVKVVQGNEAHRAYVHVILGDGSAHNISFLGGLRGPKPRFGITVNKTTHSFPEDPRAFPRESATALVGYLAANGLHVERQPLSRFEKWNWRL